MNSRPVPPGPRSRWLVGVALIVALAVLVAALILRRGQEAPGKATRSEDVPMADLVLEDGRLRRPGSSTAFTGMVVEHYPDGALRSRSAVSNGLLHGLSQGWYTNGQPQITEYFHEGTSHGLRTKWLPDGTKLSEVMIVQGQLHGIFRRWHENGRLSEQVEFVHGEPEGVSLAYFPSGYLKTRVEMQAGRVVERKTWQDGEIKQ